ncbi:MAG: archaemetzincin family Zn-dependent metalloprotease [Acidobacteriia bacterium]|nr:archaemetzincin family Zn-dependent metalloprotease [Terriglobia bacterium]
MRIVSLVPVGEVARSHLELLAEGLTPLLHVACTISTQRLDLDLAYDSLRGQYHSTAILKRLRKLPTAESWRVLGVTDADLFIPILTFVFGEAQLGPANATTAVVSMYRLRQEFYGMPPDPEMLAARLLKESLHELGHTFGLRHCADYRCVMSSSPAVENIDLKLPQFCPSCADGI